MEAQRNAVETKTRAGARQIRRRGLLAAAIALGAGAVTKLATSRRSEAANGEALIIGNAGTATEPQHTTASTQLVVDAGDIGLLVNGLGQPEIAIWGATSGLGNVGVRGDSALGGFGVQGVGAVSGGLGVQGLARRWAHTTAASWVPDAERLRVVMARPMEQRVAMQRDLRRRASMSP